MLASLASQKLDAQIHSWVPQAPIKQKPWYLALFLTFIATGDTKQFSFFSAWSTV